MAFVSVLSANPGGCCEDAGAADPESAMAATLFATPGGAPFRSLSRDRDVDLSSLGEAAGPVGALSSALPLLFG